MKPFIYHILSIFMLAVVMVGCGDDTLIHSPSDYDAEGSGVYTLNLSIDDVSPSRGVSSVDFPGLKSRWCYGDEVVLESNGGTKYTFVLETPSGKVEGAPTGNTVETFVYRGDAIPGIQSFSGKLTYTSEPWDSRVSNGCVKSAHESASLINITVDPFDLQESNDNTDHLRYADKLSATLESYDLTSGATIQLRRAFSIVKIVLDGFCYPIYGGSLLFVKGIGTKGRCMSLGINTLLLDRNSSYYDLQVVKDPADNGVVPFCGVSDRKQPLTGYAERDGNHKIVAYLVINEECTIHDGDVITVGLREQWSDDWYFWKTAPLRERKLHFGTLHTLDFTRTVGGRYQYEPVVTINTSLIAATHIAVKNVGAKNISDIGKYYMFGYDKPIALGGHYPQEPHFTPVYFYYNDENVDYLALGTINDDTGGTINGSFRFDNPASYGNGNTNIGAQNAHSVRLEGDISKHPTTWWQEWTGELAEMPCIFSEPWSPVGNLSAANFVKSNFHKIEVVGENGEPASGGVTPAGVRLSCRRTAHVIYVPISGLLEPSDKNAVHQIRPGATARIMEGTSGYAVLGARCFYLPPKNDGKSFKITSFVIDTANDCELIKQYHDLDIAMPIRAAFTETNGALSPFLENYFNGIAP